MSATVEQRVVEMRFDNRQFEQNVSTTMSTLDKLKQRLNLTGAAKGLESVGSAARGINMSGLSGAIETVQAKFSALQVIGVTALANITNSAINTGKRMISALTIDPIKSGFQEYETQINAVQTILANTQSKGTTLDQVNSALDTLNTYADKTIYNFTEMTRNIGTFTAAGVDLDTSVNAIQGIANLAATSGSTSQQASTAMYQLSQALASGTVKLQDWNSVVNAGMGGQVFQDALKETAKVHGVKIDEMIKKEGSFRETLSKGWLTSDILTETLQHFTEFTEDYNEETLKAQGYTDEQIAKIKQLGITGTEAATKVKTFTQLWDTLKEAAQSGWTQSWEIIIGDFEEAKDMLTKVSDTMGKIIGDSAEARNKLLQGWKDAGGRDDLLAGFKNIFDGIVNIAKPVREAFQDIFPPTTVKTLLNITDGFKNLTNRFKEFGTKYADQLKRTFKGIFSIVEIGRKIIVSFASAISKLVGSEGVSSLGDFLINTVASIGDFFTSLNDSFDSDGLTGLFTKIASGISNALGLTVDGLKGFGGFLSAAGNVICDVAAKIWSAVKTVFGWISENFSFADIFAGLAGGGIFMLAKKFTGLIDKIKEAFEGFFDKGEKGGGIGEKFSDILGSIHDSLESFTTGLKTASIVGIAIAIGILSASLKSISELSVGEITKSLFAIGALLTMLSIGFRSLTKTLTKFNSKGIVKTGLALVLVAGAIKILASAMERIAQLSFGEIVKGLIGVGGGLAILCVGLKYIGGTKVSLSTSIAMLALAESCKILGDALAKFSGFSWDEIGRGLTAMGGALVELVAAMSILGKFGGGGSLLGSLGILITVQSLGKMADGLKKFADMSWDEIGRGLSGMGGALLEVAGITGVLGKLAGFSSIFASGAILITVQGLSELADSLKSFASMTWEEIGRGLVGMGGALGEVAGITGVLGKLAGFSSIFASGAILITIQGLSQLAYSLKNFASMTWEEIGAGLVGMGGALGEVAGITGVLGKLAGFSSIFASGAILITIQGLGDLADAFKKFGGMSWEEIGAGLVGMGGALLEVAAITGTLGTLAGLPALLGSGAILLAVQGLGDLADALKKFGEMSWDEIGRGLAAMAGALGELALGGLLSTLSGLGAMAITEVSASLGVLADSVKKWADVTVPEGLVTQLGTLADGIEKFTFSGLGAGALSEAAPGVGIMADSVRKWTGVVVPEGIGTQLGVLADGIEKFTFSGLGAGALSVAAPGVGAMADSVQKWSGVTVPATIGEDLTSLASGVKAFSFAFVGGWSLGAIIGPLGSLADSVNKWNGVKIPEGLSDDLKGLADAIIAFSWAFVGGWSLGAITGPLGSLADSVKKWNGVSVPSGLSTDLSNLAGAVKKFSGLEGIVVSAFGISSLASATSRLAGVSYASITSGLSGIAKAITGLSSVSSSVVGLGSLIVEQLVTPLKTAAAGMSKIGTNIITSFANGIRSGQAVAGSAVSTVVNGVMTSIQSKTMLFVMAGKILATSLVVGIKSGSSAAVSAASSLASSAASGSRNGWFSFYDAGSYLVSGFAAGISANSYMAVARAAAMATAAAEAAKAALDINSPSKVFMKIGGSVPEGFALGIDKMGYYVKASVKGMADVALDNAKTAMTHVGDILSADVGSEPRIKPILDLSNVEAGANKIGTILGKDSRMSVLANVDGINTMMNRRSQNGANTDVVSAIDKLRKDVSKINANNYNINGVTYDDGSAVGNAVNDLIRAIRVEGRI